MCLKSCFEFIGLLWTLKLKTFKIYIQPHFLAGLTFSAFLTINKTMCRFCVIFNFQIFDHFIEVITSLKPLFSTLKHFRSNFDLNLKISLILKCPD